ncbi:MAG: hypothetical protein LBG47_05835 [Prevotellaceae bacterium]|jgi:hypothetical protein|nr:hypothetical protein [Prevotellaceae bacterium]
MSTLTYLFESGICAATLWLTYRCLLSREVSFALNRFYLLASMPLSFAIPLLHLPLLPAADVAVATLADAPPAKEAEAAAACAAGLALLPALYFAVAGGLAVRLALRLYGAYRAAAAGRISHQETCYAFTFFRKIYLSKELLAHAQDYENILLHEQAHARQLHSLDLLIADLFAALQWFNPWAWRFKKSLVELHEYIADAYAATRGAGLEAYMQLLYRQTVGLHPDYGSGFNHSLTKKRLSMMTKNKTSKLFTLKMLAIAPVAALLVALLGCEQQQRNAQAAGAAAPLPAGSSANSALPDTVAVTLKTGKVLILVGAKEAPTAEQLAAMKISPDSIEAVAVFKGAGRAQNPPDAGRKSSGDSVTITLKTGKVITLIETAENPLEAQIAALTLDAAEIQSVEVKKGR